VKIQDYLKQFLFGIHFPSEYLHVAKESFTDTFEVYWLDEKKHFITDVSSYHYLFGYRPVLIAINKSISKAPLESFLSFKLKGEEIALLKLELLHDMPKEVAGIHFYRCTNGKHRFISNYLQWINSLLLKLKNNSLNDIEVFSNHYEQVRIAYSVPRTVAVITVSNGKFFNLFPLDLHGRLNGNIYALTLRENSKSSKQIEECKKILLSEMDIRSGDEIAVAGKNHIKEMQPSDKFAFSNSNSPTFNLPTPKNYSLYYELELFSMKDLGFHRIYFFKIIHQQRISENHSTYAHIHRYAAEWRKKNNIPTVYGS
jgi:hypothetical protein